ncbi:hypothetical protein C8R44DRAFT_853645 [Mycena epipterygia]|nr:hypothetical protein C8R44DRAFT_853645 [Mycena epipterygia]
METIPGRMPLADFHASNRCEFAQEIFVRVEPPDSSGKSSGRIKHKDLDNSNSVHINYKQNGVREAVGYGDVVDLSLD